MTQIRLLNVPKPQPFESQTGYYFRLANANHTDLQTLFRATRLSGGNEQSLWSAEAKYSQPVHKKFCEWWRGLRVCAVCLRGDSTPYLRELWEGPLAVLCPEHRVRLVGYCPQCAVPLSSHRRHLTKCDCGLDFRALKPQGLTRSLGRALMFHAMDLTSFDRLLVSSTNQGLVTASCAALKHIVLTAYGEAPEPGYYDKHQRLHRSNTVFDVIEPWFDNWPHDAQRIWSNYRQVTRTEVWRWDVAYPVHLLARFTTQKVVFELLESAKFEAVPAGNHRMWHGNASYMSDAEFCERTGMSHAEAWWWMQTIIDAAPQDLRAPVARVNRRRARALIAILNLTEDVTRAAQFAGLDSHVLQALVHEQIVDSIWFAERWHRRSDCRLTPNGAYRIALKDIISFLSIAFKRHHQRCSQSLVNCGFSKALGIAQKERCVRSFMLAIAAGDLTTYCDVPSPVLASQLYFDPSQVSQFIENNRLERNTRCGGVAERRSVRDAIELAMILRSMPRPDIAYIRDGQAITLRI